jgi:uncharacterized protein (TIGR03546 family)
MIKSIAKLIVALNGNVKKGQIAAGFAWGVLLALVPAGNFFWIVLFLLSFFLRHNQASKLLVMVIGKLLLPLAVYAIDAFGWAVLHIDALQPFFTTLYNMPFVPFTRFYNTMVAGGLAGGIILWLPVFFITLGLVSVYRNTLAPKIKDSKLAKFIGKIPFISSISKAVSGLAGKGA